MEPDKPLTPKPGQELEKPLDQSQKPLRKMTEPPNLESLMQ